MKVPIRVPRVVAPGARMIVDAVMVQAGTTVARGDLLLTVRIGSLAASLHSPVDGVVQDVRAASGDELMPDRIALWVESEALPPMEAASVLGADAAPSTCPAGVVFRLPEVLLRARVPRVQRVLVRTGDQLQAGAPVIDVALGPLRFQWTTPAPATVTRVLVKEGDALPEGTPLLECGGERATPAAPERIAPHKLELPELSLAGFRERAGRLREQMLRLTGLVEQAGLANSAELLRTEAERLTNTHFTVAVVGEFKRGKSTFLNALPVENSCRTMWFPALLLPAAFSMGNGCNWLC